MPFAQGDVTGWIGYEYVGQRFEDQFGLQPLGTYSMLQAGLVFDYGSNWQIRVQGTTVRKSPASTQ